MKLKKKLSEVYSQLTNKTPLLIFFLKRKKFLVTLPTKLYYKSTTQIESRQKSLTKKKKKVKIKKNLAFHLPFNFLKKKKRGGKKNKKGQKEKRKPSTRPEEPGESGSSPKRKHSTREYFVN